MFYQLGGLAFYDEDLTPERIGGKAFNLLKMGGMGLKVPRAFVIPTEYCAESCSYAPNSAFAVQLNSYIRYLAKQNNRSWGWGPKPQLVSVRSGAPISMPGMMDTILNVGLTRDNIGAFVEDNDATKAFGLDCYRRLIEMYGKTVDDIPKEIFDEVYKSARIFYDDFNEDVYKNLVDLYEERYQSETGHEFTSSSSEQLLNAVNSVFKSWYSDKAVQYREIEGIPHDMGTAVTIQEMIFGNIDDKSATGVVFTHDPNNGKVGWYGEYMIQAQGEDVVSGTHQTLPIKQMLRDESLAPAARELQTTLGTLWRDHRDILDIEFTIQSGQLYFLQYRVAKVARRAAVRSILDMTKAGNISTTEAVGRVLKMLPTSSSGLNNPDLVVVGKGTPACGEIVTGYIAVGSKEAERRHKASEPYVYVASETAPDDVQYMKNAVGVLTAFGGPLSHAAVIARYWNLTCVVGFNSMKILKDGIEHNGEKYNNECVVRINGSTGEVFL